MPFVAVNDSYLCAHRGYPKSLTVDKFKAESGWQSLLDKFCQELGITPPDGQQPQWWLVSDWN